MLFAPPAPLAERMRPQSLEEVIGQKHLLGPNKPLRKMLEGSTLSSLIFWGPPGTGKTTLARLLAQTKNAHFIALSAVSAGVADVREAVKVAELERSRGRRTLLFLDEIHRFNKAQQDALLPHLESGMLTLIGATTENPSFEVNPALRSRARILTLEPLSQDEIKSLIERALAESHGLPGHSITPQALDLLSRLANGDGRSALVTLEVAAQLAEPVNEDVVLEAHGRHAPSMDKEGEAFYNLISALHKSVRASHPDAALYWLARMLEGGADPLYVARRVVRMSVEDIGLADPHALRLCNDAREALEFLGSPEGDLALAQAVVYLALAPKSNSVYRAWKRARDAASESSYPIPLHLRNAPTAFMKAQGYGVGYAYYFDDPEGSFAQSYLPEALEGTEFYQASGEGWEERVKARLEALRRLHGKGEG